MLSAEAPGLAAKSREAMRWQMSRILKSGKVSKEGKRHCPYSISMYSCTVSPGGSSVRVAKRRPSHSYTTR